MPYSRELRRLTLATRMIRLRARTQTVCEWTGLARPKVQRISREMRGQEGVGRKRPHGPPPKAMRPFWESRRLRREGAAVAGLCTLSGVIPRPGMAEEGWAPGVPRGERLCLAYETFLTFIPHPRLTLEHAALLAAALARGLEAGLEACPGCGNLLLADRLGLSRRCGDCRG